MKKCSPTLIDALICIVAGITPVHIRGVFSYTAADIVISTLVSKQRPQTGNIVMALYSSGMHPFARVSKPQD
jgi:hypothetical protein